jgi:hypothetical protein
MTQVLSAVGATGRPHTGHDIEAVMGRALRTLHQSATSVPSRDDAFQVSIEHALQRCAEDLCGG